jgi:hypothetical protein
MSDSLITHTQKLKGLQIQQAELNFLQGISVLLMNNAKDYSGKDRPQSLFTTSLPKDLTSFDMIQYVCSTYEREGCSCALYEVDNGDIETEALSHIQI